LGRSAEISVAELSTQGDDIVSKCRKLGRRSVDDIVQGKSVWMLTTLGQRVDDIEPDVDYTVSQR
jgi:hypothetical protein